MSESILQTQDQEFAVNVGFITKRRAGIEGDLSGEYIALDTGVISYLEIEENLLDMGYTGTISVKNPFQILDRLQALNTTEDTLYLDINLEDLQTATKKTEDRCLTFMSLIESSGAISENIINNELIFKFEEAQSAMLKKTSLYKLNNIKNGITIPKQFEKIGSYLRNIIQKWAVEAKIENPIHPDTSFFKSDNGYKGHIRSFWQSVDESVYDVLYKIAENILINEGGKELLPILKIASYNNPVDANNDSIATVNKVDRVFTFKEMFSDRHREFLRAIMAGDTSGDFSDVYQEEFTLSPEKSSNINSSFQNTVENYEMLKTDITSARELFWGDYVTDNGPVNITRTIVGIEKMPFIVDSLEVDDYGNIDDVNCSIPVLDNIERKLFEADRAVHTEESRDIIRDYVWNRVKKSCIMLNDTVVFTVEGRMFRKPGKFITINGGDVFDRTKPNNVWLVLSVKHIFTGLVYENEVVAVRLFGNKKRYLEYFPDIIDESVNGILFNPLNAFGTQSVGANSTGQSVPGQRQTVPMDSSVQLTSTNLKEFVKNKEGFTTTVVPDYGNNSIGYGTKATRNEISSGAPISQAEAERRLDTELAYARGEVIAREKKYGYNWNENQRDALTSFAFNLGPGAIDQVTDKGSRDNTTIANKMILYDKAGGKRLPGLSTRREQEQQIFKSGYTTS